MCGAAFLPYKPPDDPVGRAIWEREIEKLRTANHERGMVPPKIDWGAINREFSD